MPRKLYGKDFYLWPQQMAEALRASERELDRENVAEEMRAWEKGVWEHRNRKRHEGPRSG